MSRKGIPNKISKKVPAICKQCEASIMLYPCRVKETGNFCSAPCQRAYILPAFVERSIGNRHGAKRLITNELRQKISAAHKGKKRPNGGLAKQGARNPNWRGGVTSEHKRLRNSAEYREWREAVFQRDNWTCQFCGVRGQDLHPDHIKPFAYFPDLRFEVSNGRTLCIPCHKTTPTYGAGARQFAMTTLHTVPRDQK